jgi:hypothetical protein
VEVDGARPLGSRVVDYRVAFEVLGGVGLVGL